MQSGPQRNAKTGPNASWCHVQALHLLSYLGKEEALVLSRVLPQTLQKTSGATPEHWTGHSGHSQSLGRIRKWENRREPRSSSPLAERASFRLGNYRRAAVGTKGRRQRTESGRIKRRIYGWGTQWRRRIV